MECPMCFCLLTEAAECESPKPAKGAKTSSEQKNVPDQDRQLCSLRCGHIFHKKCALSWLKHKGKHGYSSCPTCRREYKESHLRVLYLPAQEDKPELIKQADVLLKEKEDLKNEMTKLKKKLANYEKAVDNVRKYLQAEFKER